MHECICADDASSFPLTPAPRSKLTNYRHPGVPIKYLQLVFCSNNQRPFFASLRSGPISFRYRFRRGRGFDDLKNVYGFDNEPRPGQTAAAGQVHDVEGTKVLGIRTHTHTRTHVYLQDVN